MYNLREFYRHKLFTKEAYKNVILVLARIRLEIFIYLQEHFAIMHLFIYVPYPPDKYLDEFYNNFKIHIFF